MYTALALLAGCQPRVPLSEVPIFGGGVAAQTEARAELAAFDGWVGPGRVRLASLEFLALGDDPAAGMYFRESGRLILDEALPADRVRATLRHELCHALDWQEGLLDRPHPAWDALGSVLFSPVLGELRYLEDQRGRRSEALAQLCEIGPFGAHARVTRCDGESVLGPDLAAWGVGQVWRGFPHPGETAAALEATTACCTTGAAWGGFAIWPTVDPERVLVELRPGDGGEEVRFQAWLETGDPAPSAVGLGSVREPPPLPEGAVPGAIAGWPTGPAAAVVGFPVPSLGETAPRLIVSDGAGWSLPAQPCLVGPLADPRLFTADGRVWRAWRDGEALRWAEVR